jgi:sorbitol-specific phosphotransferase system component IIC
MRIRHWVTSARKTIFRNGADAGMTTAEYAVGTLAACALAAVLLAIVQSGGITSLITEVITTALSVAL